MILLALDEDRVPSINENAAPDTTEPLPRSGRQGFCESGSTTEPGSVYRGPFSGTENPGGARMMPLIWSTDCLI